MGSGLISVVDRTMMTDPGDNSQVDGHHRTIKVTLWRERRSIDVEIHDGDMVIDIVKKVGLPIDGTLVFDGDIPLPIDGEITGYPELKIISVASGG
ncbi:MAG: hypothetical protein KAH57_04025 [Thermoplasmata archaeon]|nr:hypothetical protein [Thermoplasmata archaeon]